MSLASFGYAVCQTLRILSFTSTQLPSPNYHCRLPELTAIKDMPLHWWGHFIVDLGRQASLLLTLPSLDNSWTAYMHAGFFHAFIVSFLVHRAIVCCESAAHVRLSSFVFLVCWTEVLSSVPINAAVIAECFAHVQCAQCHTAVVVMPS